jgi:hypothetical protein
VKFSFATVKGMMQFKYRRSTNPDSCFVPVNAMAIDSGSESDGFMVGFRNDICKKNKEVMSFVYSVHDSTGINPMNASELYRFIKGRSLMLSIEISGLNRNASEEQLEKLADQLKERFADAYTGFKADKLMGIEAYASFTIEHIIDGHSIELYFLVDQIKVYDSNDDGECCSDDSEGE